MNENNCLSSWYKSADEVGVSAKSFLFSSHLTTPITSDAFMQISRGPSPHIFALIAPIRLACRLSFAYYESKFFLQRMVRESLLQRWNVELIRLTESPTVLKGINRQLNYAQHSFAMCRFPLFYALPRVSNSVTFVTWSISFWNHTTNHLRMQALERACNV